LQSGAGVVTWHAPATHDETPLQALPSSQSSTIVMEVEASLSHDTFVPRSVMCTVGETLADGVTSMQHGCPSMQGAGSVMSFTIFVTSTVPSWSTSNSYFKLPLPPLEAQSWTVSPQPAVAGVGVNVTVSSRHVWLHPMIESGVSPA